MRTPVIRTDYGFEWGPMAVQRTASGPRLGYILSIVAGDRVMEVRCSVKGRNLSATVRPFTLAPLAKLLKEMEAPK